MTRTFLAFATLAAFMSACAPMPPPPQAPAAVATADYDAAQITVYAGLRLCPGGSAYNVGTVTVNGLAADYTPYIDSAGLRLLRNPTEGACISSGFGLRPDATGGGRDHLGIDLMARPGSFIYAASPGRVTIAGFRGDFGLLVEIDHGGGLRTRYAHLSEINPRLRPGVEVPGATAIGRMGATGRATGVHLHYEVLVRGVHVDPLAYGKAAE
jgi:murein DD-endopeptidase MepM/ murein hydrolase activator NlpD